MDFGTIGSTLTDSYKNYGVKDTKKATSKQNSESATDSQKTQNRQTDTESAVYEKGNEETKKPTYSINKMSEGERAELVKKMQLDLETRSNQMSELIRKMFDQQAKADGTALCDLFSEENLKLVSPEEIAQAKEDVAEDGYWGVKQTSQRMFDFACALAGDDVDKMKEMQKAMEKGYEMATKAWGKELPQLCKDTMDAANKLFEDYYSSKETETE